MITHIEFTKLFVERTNIQIDIASGIIKEEHYKARMCFLNNQIELFFIEQFERATGRISNKRYCICSERHSKLLTKLNNGEVFSEDKIKELNDMAKIISDYKAQRWQS